TRSLNLISTSYESALLGKRAIPINCRLKPRQDADLCQGVYHGVTERVKRHDLTGVSACQCSGGGSILAEHFGGLCLGTLAQRRPFVLDRRGTAAQCLGDGTLVQQGNGWLNVLRLDVGNTFIIAPLVAIAGTGQRSGGPTKQPSDRDTSSTRYPLEESGHQGFKPSERSGLFLVVVLSVDHEHAVDALHRVLQARTSQAHVILTLCQLMRIALYFRHDGLSP